MSVMLFSLRTLASFSLSLRLSISWFFKISTMDQISFSFIGHLENVPPPPQFHHLLSMPSIFLGLLECLAKSLLRFLALGLWDLWEFPTDELLALDISSWFLLHTWGTTGHVHAMTQPLAPNLHVTTCHVSHVSRHNLWYEFSLEAISTPRWLGIT